MNRKEKYKDFREQCSETKLIDILDMQDKKINLLMNRVEHLVDMVEKQSNYLYELVKEEKEIFENQVYKEDFDEMFKESLDELEKIINWDEKKHNIPHAEWYEDTDKREPDKEMIYVRPDGTEYMWLDDMWVRI